MLKAVHRHTNQPWVLLYIERGLKAPAQMEDGSVVSRVAGAPQGGVVSFILAILLPAAWPLGARAQQRNELEGKVLAIQISNA